MKNKTDSGRGNGFIRSASTEKLRSTQSVRATFRLSSDSIQAIHIIVTQLGIKPKSLFDHLLEDIESMQKIAPRLRMQAHELPDRIQKTFVISKKSLSFLDATARKHNASRDVLVESLVRRLLPVITEEKKKHRIRKTMLEKIASHFKSGAQLLDGLGRDLGRNDPFYTEMIDVLSGYEKALAHMTELVEKGEVLEEFTPGTMAALQTNLQSSRGR